MAGVGAGVDDPLLPPGPDLSLPVLPGPKSLARAASVLGLDPLATVLEP